MNKIQSMAIYCGSGMGNDEAFVTQTKLLGKTLAEKNITAIYGGAKIGLMGILADAIIENGGHVVGVLPHFLKDKEIAHPNLDNLVLCQTMAQRKEKMFELAQAHMALPGGLGTLDELLEILTLQQLGHHQHPVGLLNVNGFYDQLRGFLTSVSQKGLLKKEHLSNILFGDHVHDLIGQMENFQINVTDKVK